MTSRYPLRRLADPSSEELDDGEVADEAEEDAVLELLPAACRMSSSLLLRRIADFMMPCLLLPSPDAAAGLPTVLHLVSSAQRTPFVALPDADAGAAAAVAASAPSDIS